MSRMKIGWSKREISIDEPVVIPGQMYLRISEGIHDPLYVTALCVDGGEDMDQVIFLSCDIATIWGNMLAPIQEAVAAKNSQIPTEAIIVNATHTHSGTPIGGSMEVTPDGMPIFSGDRYKVFFVQMCAEAICEAWEKREEGGMGYGYGYAVVAHSRRVVYFEKEKMARNETLPRDFMTPRGYAAMYGNTNDPLFSHYEAGDDHFLNLMFTFDKENKLTGIVVNVPCPSQLAEHFTKLSADYWNEVRQLVGDEFGDDVYVLPQCAAAGDLSPRVLHYREAQERRMALKYNMPYKYKEAKAGTVDDYNKTMTERYDIAERIMVGIKDVFSWAKKDIYTEVPVRHVYKVMALHRRPITDEEKAWCEENLELLKDMEPKKEEMSPEQYRKEISIYNNKVGRNEYGIERYYDVKENPTLDMGCHIVQIGDIGFSTMRFELYHDFMHRLQARSPFMQTFVVQLCGAEGGNYLSTHRGSNARGYSASMFCNMVSADGGQQWVEESLAVMNEMKAKDKA